MKSRIPKEPIPRGQLLMGLVCLVICGLVITVQFPALFSPFAGGFHDDGIYLVTAKALAEGKGYVIDSLPAALAQTKYPVLFPALLSTLWTFNPEYPSNLPLLRIVPFAAFWLWLWLVWKIVAHEFGRRELAFWTVVLMACSPTNLFLSTTLLSETLFAATSTWAILLLVRADKNERAVSVHQVLLIAAVMAAAFHTRTIGIALIPAALLVFARRRAYSAGLLAMALWGVLCAPWIIWQQLHPIPSAPGLLYYTSANYSGWNLITGGQSSAFGTVVWFNAIRLLAQPVHLWALPSVFAQAWLLAVVAALTAAGSILLLFTNGRAAAAWLVSTGAIVLAWMWPPIRFMVPVMPFAILATAELPSRLNHRVVTWSGRIAGAALAAWGIAASWPGARSEYTAGIKRATEVVEAAFWIEQHVPPDVVLAANLDPVYYLHTGRRAIRSFTADPRLLFYSPDSATYSLGGSDALRDVLVSHCAGYLVLEHLPDYYEYEPLVNDVLAFGDEFPAALTETWRSSTGVVNIYRVNREALGRGDERCAPQEVTRDHSGSRDE